MRLGGKPTAGFAEQNQIAELDGVAAEFDRLVATLGQTAESIRRRAEDNAHAFKTPIAIMRQCLEPLRRALPEDNPRGRRAAEVMEKAVDRLDSLDHSVFSHGIDAAQFGVVTNGFEILKPIIQGI